MAKNGWGLNTFLSLLGMLVLCLIMITILSKKIVNTVTINTYKTINILSSEPISNNIIPSDLTRNDLVKEYNNIENNIVTIVRNYTSNKYFYGNKIIISFTKLIELGYINKIIDPNDSKNECNGYIIYDSQNINYKTFLSCIGNYQTANYNKDLE